MKRNHSSLESPRRRLLLRGHRGHARLSFENLETRLALAVNVEDFSNDFDSTIAGYDSWDTDPLTVPRGDIDADPATTLGPDELLIPHDIGPRSRFDFNRHGNATHYLAIVGGLSPESYVIDFAGGRGQPGGLASDAEVVTVGFRYNGGGRVEVVGDHGLKTLDVSNFASWVGLAVTSNDPADTGGEVGAIQSVRFTAGGDLLNVDDISVLVFDAGFSNNPPVAFDDSLVVRAVRTV